MVIEIKTKYEQVVPARGQRVHEAGRLAFHWRILESKFCGQPGYILKLNIAPYT